MHLSVILLLGLPLASGWWAGLEQLTYKESQSACSPGNLATFSTNEELNDLLLTNQELRVALDSTSHSFFWIGLEKPKDLCVVPALPQRGFRFVDDRTDSELSRWREEPRDTCTNVRCGAVALGSGSWGLVSQSCKSRNHFICGPRESGPRPETKPETRPETRPEPKHETRPETRPESKHETRPETRPEGPDGTGKPDQEQTRLSPGFVLDLGPNESPDPGLPSELDQTRPTFGPGLVSESEPSPDPGPDHSPDQDPSPRPSLNEKSDQTPGRHPSKSPVSAVPSPDPDPGFHSGPGSSLSPGPSSGPSCPLPKVPGSRFLFDSEPRKVSVACWSGEVLLLRCVHGVWTRTRPDSGPDPTPDPSPGPSPEPSPDPDLTSGPGLNQSALRPGGQSGALRCSDCGPGFMFKDGECEDVDECSLSPAPCAHGCVNTNGSFTCTPSTLSHALVHSLIAVAAVTLAVIVAVTVWCCLRKKRRRDQKPDQDLNQNQTEV